VGDARKFQRALARVPLQEWPRATGAKGPHKGITTPNVPWEITALCMGDTVNIEMFEALHTVISFKGLHDLLEVHEANESAKNAHQLNNMGS
jgi:hypothetical protein